MTSENERPQAATSTDTLTILTSRGPLLTKRWRADGTIQATDKAKHYRVQTTTVDGIKTLHRALTALYDQPTRAVIRGHYTGEPEAARAGEVTRTMESFTDQALHAHMLDVDRFECLIADPLDDPAAAVREYVLTLPAEYHVASYSWALSPSAGHPSKPAHELRAHVWFWDRVPRTSAERQAWAVVASVPTDKAVLHPVQLHYTAGPVLDDGVTDPLADRRVGYYQGEQDVVDVAWDAPAIAVQLATGGRRVSSSAGSSGQDYPDPRAKRGLIGAFCRAFTPEDVLTAPWFTEPMEPVPGSSRRWTWAAPGHPPEGCFLTDDGAYFVNTHDSAPAGTIRKGLNAYDLARVYVYGHLDEGVPEDDQWAWAVDPTSRPSDQALRAWARQLPAVQAELEAERASRTMDDEPPAPAPADAAPSVAATKVRDMTERHGAEMRDRVRFALATAGLTDTEVQDVLDLDVLTRAWRGTFYNTRESRAYFLSQDDYLVNFGPQDWPAQAALAQGHLLRREPLQAAAQRLATAAGNNAPAAPIEKALRDAAWGVYAKYVKHYRQRALVDFEVDIFRDQGYVRILPESAAVTHGWTPFDVARLAAPVSADITELVMAEYRQHFPLFDVFLDLILHARFANDRREAFAWLQAASSWGKGFLLQAVLGPGGLNVVCELSVKEIEAALEGKPAGVSIEQIRRALVIWVDEFKSAKGELKQLNSHFMAAPKNQLRFRAAIYTKVFTSAELVESLAGPDGVEGQFAERFSLLDMSAGGRLDDLPVFQAVGKGVYRDVLIRHAAEHINAGVARMRALGRAEAGRVADVWLHDFRLAHGLGNSYTRLEDNLDTWAGEIKALIQDYARADIGLGTAPRYLDKLAGPLKSALAGCVRVVRGSRTAKGEIGYLAVVQRPVRLVKAWISSHIDHSQVTMISHKARHIAEVITRRDLNVPARWYTERADGERDEHKLKVALIDITSTVQDFDDLSNVVTVDFGAKEQKTDT